MIIKRILNNNAVMSVDESEGKRDCISKEEW